MLDQDRLPNLGRIFRRGARVLNATSVFPSAALPCQASLITGCHPGQHGLIGNRWFVRFGKHPKYREYAQPISAMDLHGIKLFGTSTVLLPQRTGPSPADSDLSGSARTIYEDLNLRKVRAGVVFNPLARGAHEWIRPSRLDIAQYARCRNGKLDFAAFDKSVMKRTAHYLEDCRKVPRLFMVFFPGLDGHSHRHGPDAQQKYLQEVLDPIFGELLTALAEHHPIEHFTFILTSDHGHAPVRPDPEYRITYNHMSHILRKNHRKPTPLLPGVKLRDRDVIMMEHGGSMHLAVKNGATMNWYDPPRMHQDLLRLGVDIVDASKESVKNLHPDWLDIVLVKDLESKRYLVLREHKVYTCEKFFEHNRFKPLYPDAVNRIGGYFSQHSPDLILLSNYERGFYFDSDGEFSGHHGGLSFLDSSVPLIFSGFHISEREITSASIVDISQTIASLFSTNHSTSESKPLPVLSSPSESFPSLFRNINP